MLPQVGSTKAKPDKTVTGAGFSLLETLRERFAQHQPTAEFLSVNQE
ncbi:hypothetical protein [Nodosilinea nodulosa]|nr:hypothetical protein [Nodosilinea nodulosa]